MWKYVQDVEIAKMAAKSKWLTSYWSWDMHPRDFFVDLDMVLHVCTKFHLCSSICSKGLNFLNFIDVTIELFGYSFMFSGDAPN